MNRWKSCSKSFYFSAKFHSTNHIYISMKINNYKHIITTIKYKYAHITQHKVFSVSLSFNFLSGCYTLYTTLLSRHSYSFVVCFRCFFFFYSFFNLGGCWISRIWTIRIILLDISLTICNKESLLISNHPKKRAIVHLLSSNFRNNRKLITSIFLIE